MELRVVKSGKSLAIHIPADFARSIGIRAGDCLEASLTIDGGLTIRPPTWNRKAFAKNLTMARTAMPLGKSVMDEVRRGGRY